MKKLRLKALEIGAVEVLSRAQLKNVMAYGGSGDSDNDCNEECDGACTYTCSGSSQTYQGRCGNSRGTCTCAGAC